MGLFDRFTKKKEETKIEVPTSEASANQKPKAPRKATKPKKPASPKKPKAKLNQELDPIAKEKSEATARGEPWVKVIGIELDPDNVGQGAFEIDWNEYFVLQLTRAGYQGKTDQDIVDQWFQTICRNIALEIWEQYEADPTTRINRRNIGGGRTEVS